MSVSIKKQLVTSRKSTYGAGNPARYITIHETANAKRGAGAQAHANLQSNGYSASWHYQVDDKGAIQSFPHNVKCWHAGDGRSGAGNNQSIAIEICVNSDSNFRKAVDNAIALTKKIMRDEGIPVANVVQHNRWSGKNCPTNLRKGSKGINWTGFINALKSDTNAKPNPTPNPPSSNGNSAYTGGSIVTYLNSIGVSSTFNNRAKLAQQYGISNYRGTAKQNTDLLNIMRNPTPKKTISQMASEVIAGKHGNGHENRRKSLDINQTEYNKVRAEVNRRA